MNENTEGGLCQAAEPKLHWTERLRCRLFPERHADLPEAPPHWKDVIHNTTHVHLSFIDRVKLIFTGLLVVRIKIVCENEVGNTKTSSAAFPTYE